MFDITATQFVCLMIAPALLFATGTSATGIWQHARDGNEAQFDVSLWYLVLVGPTAVLVALHALRVIV